MTPTLDAPPADPSPSRATSADAATPARAVILVGVGRYADPWHPYPATTVPLSEILRERGMDVETVKDVDAWLAQLGVDEAGSLPDLVVANLGRPDPRPDGDEPGAAGLARLLERVPILALHSAANCFPESEAWERRLGGRWLPEISWHPSFGSAHVCRVEELPGVTDGIAELTLEDERYVDLRLGEGRRVLYEHEHPRGGTAPTIWVTGAKAGGVRTAYDALGHDGRSYESPEHREILGRLAEWLVGAEPERG